MAIAPEKIIAILRGDHVGSETELGLSRAEIARVLQLNPRHPELVELIRSMTAAGYLIRERQSGVWVYVMGRDMTPVPAGGRRPTRAEDIPPGVEPTEYERAVAEVDRLNRRPHGARPGGPATAPPGQRQPAGQLVGDGILHGAVQRDEALCGASIARMPAVGPPGSEGWTTLLEVITCPGCISARDTRRPAPAGDSLFFPATSATRHGLLPGVTALTACGEPVATLPEGEYVAEGGLISPSCQPCISEISTHGAESEHRHAAAVDLAEGRYVHLLSGSLADFQLGNRSDAVCGIQRSGLWLPEGHSLTVFPARANCTACIAAHGAPTGYPVAAYAQGRHDQGAGTVDTSRTADRGYVQGLADERAAQIERADERAAQLEHGPADPAAGPTGYPVAAYAQGRHDQGAGTVDTSRTADRGYVQGVADERAAQVDAELAEARNANSQPGPDAMNANPGEDATAWPPGQADEAEVRRRHDAVREEGLLTGYDARPGDTVVHVELGTRGIVVSADRECVYVRYDDTTAAAGDLTHAGDLVVIHRAPEPSTTSPDVISATGPFDLSLIDIHKHRYASWADLDERGPAAEAAYRGGREDYARQQVSHNRYLDDAIYARGVRDEYVTEGLKAYRDERAPTGWTPPEPKWTARTFADEPAGYRDEAEEAWRHRVERIDYWRRQGRLTDADATALLDTMAPGAVIADEEPFRRHGTSGRFDPAYVDAVEKLDVDAAGPDGTCRHCGEQLGTRHAVETGPDGRPRMVHPPWNTAEGTGTYYDEQATPGVLALVPGDPVAHGDRLGIFEYLADGAELAFVTFAGATEPEQVPARSLRPHGRAA